MPTHDSHCTWCGQHRQAEQDLREAMMALRRVMRIADEVYDSEFSTRRGKAFAPIDDERAMLALLDERYGR